ncbi:TIGR00341 family protein [Pontixanthobacter sp. CEM42]|uniref:TIGR00341 family protein n=1 Tax=Pontixanthobacter sp. CEM42 TaxID=2792077 RepID=UPI001ADF96C0|nr:TIGR00341 family protein [Pontixanthobacter sp. CEM42]
MASQPPVPSTKTNDLQFARVILSFRKWWRDDVVGTVDQHAVIEKRRAECVMSARYMFMTAMSGGIAILGLLLSSPAVVIGAMLLSPLMDPIMGLGFALAIGDYKWLRRSAKSLAWGSILAIGLCALVVFLSPIQDITSEIASRTRPNLFDLLVAVFSALAGAYAMIRGREGTIVGVAIATALMPPLAVVGFGLATGNWTVFSGALLLYVTNLMAIALIAALMARIYGFRTRLSDKQTLFQNFAIVAVFVALAVPLGLSLRQIAWEANSERQIRNELSANFGSAARLSQPEVSFSGDAINVTADVWTPQFKADAETKAEEHLTQALGRPVDVELKQLLVRDEKGAEQAQLASAQEEEEAAASERAEELASRLALMAGVEESEVMVDRQRRRAMVKATELDGAPLATYFDLEKRIAATEPEWRVELIPPAKALPAIAFEDGEPTEAGSRALALIAWSSGRVGAPVVLSGPPAAVERAQKELVAAGVPLVATEIARGPNVTAKWGSVER